MAMVPFVLSLVFYVWRQGLPAGLQLGIQFRLVSNSQQFSCLIQVWVTLPGSMHRFGHTVISFFFCGFEWKRMRANKCGGGQSIALSPFEIWGEHLHLSDRLTPILVPPPSSLSPHPWESPSFCVWGVESQPEGSNRGTIAKVIESVYKFPASGRGPPVSSSSFWNSPDFPAVVSGLEQALTQPFYFLPFLLGSYRTGNENWGAGGGRGGAVLGSHRLDTSLNFCKL